MWYLDEHILVILQVLLSPIQLNNILKFLHSLGLCENVTDHRHN